MKRQHKANDLCWCGSGRLYTQCHATRAQEAPLPHAAKQHMIYQSFKGKRCLHPLASSAACGKIIDAHTLQRAGILRRIGDPTGHVLTFYPFTYDENRQLVLHRRGLKEASTFRGFCSRHDGPTFHALESQPFIGTPEQHFLLAYRALCHEVYQKQSAIEAYTKLSDVIDRGKRASEQQRDQEHIRFQQELRIKGLEDLENYKMLMDRQLVERRYTGWSHTTIHCSGPVCIASTGVVTPTYDIYGVKLQRLETRLALIQCLFYGMVPSPDGVIIVFSWHTAHPVGKAFMSAFLALSRERLPTLLAQLMFVYVENTFFADAWWSSLTEQQRKTVYRLVHTDDAYSQPVSYSDDQLVPWMITDIQSVQT